VIDISHDYSVEEYLADRDLSSGGRYGRHVLGDTGWRGFLERAKGEFKRSFGDRPSTTVRPYWVCERGAELAG
jgi:hypothetical protein